MATKRAQITRPFTFLRWRVITPVAACLVLGAAVFAYEQHASKPREEPAPALSEAPPTTMPSNVAPPESAAAPSGSALNAAPPTATPNASAVAAAAAKPSARTASATLTAGSPFTPSLPRSAASPSVARESDRSARARHAPSADIDFPSASRNGNASGSVNPALPSNGSTDSNAAFPHTGSSSGSSANPALPNNSSSSSFELP